MALADWTVTPLSFQISGTRADVIVGFHNSVTPADFKEHVQCTDLDSLKVALVLRIAQLDQTDQTSTIKPALNLPLDLNPVAVAPQTPFEKFQGNVRTLKGMKIAIDLTVKKFSDADFVALVGSVAADLVANPTWISAF